MRKLTLVVITSFFLFNLIPLPSHAQTLLCQDDGKSGKRVVVVLVNSTQESDLSVVKSVVFKAEEIFRKSAQRQGGVRYVRWVTQNCELFIERVKASSLDEVMNLSEFQRLDRKTLIFWVGNLSPCSGSTIYPDDRPGAENRNNFGPTFAYVSTYCFTPHSVAHEMGHFFGAVQKNAPNATLWGHCLDGDDVMCYPDNSSNRPFLRTCFSAPGIFFGCNEDTYWNLNPAPDSYLATHWNMANNLFLSTDPKEALFIPITYFPLVGRR